MNVINQFTGKYYFLSNFYPCAVTYKEITYKNSEAAFQAQKCPRIAFGFKDLSPSEAKRKGRHVTLREDWEHVKNIEMYDICLAKFQQNPDLKQQLINTGDAILIEGNDWGDKYWGICNGSGENELGKILMNIRDRFRYYKTGLED